MKKARVHSFQISATFDKACGAGHALREMRDTIHGEFYPTQRSDAEPGKYRVRTIGKLPAPPRPRPIGRIIFIPDNELGVAFGDQDVVELLRQHCESPAAVHFIADMLE